MMLRRRCLLRLALLAAPAALTQAALAQAALAQQAKPQRPAPGPSLSAPRTLMAGAMASAFVSRAPDGARLAIARPTDPPEAAIVAAPLQAASVLALPAPGEAGSFELRLLAERDGKPVILLRQPLTTTTPGATLAAPRRVGRSQALPIRGVGPNGDRDRIVLTRPGEPAEAEGPCFYPAENVEDTLEAPAEAGIYELRYVMNAPLSGQRVLARQEIVVE